MNPANILHTFFKMSQCKVISDKRRQNTLLDCVGALDKRGKLEVTGLGRGLKTRTAKAKHNIKRVYRLLAR